MKPSVEKLMRLPRHLSAHSRRWAESILSRYEIEPQLFELLVKAGEAWDRCEQARKAILQHGVTYSDRFGAPRARPEVAIERDARLAFVRIVRELGLESESTTMLREAPTIPRRVA